MKKAIALINLRYKVDIGFERKESLALGYLAGVLRKEGHNVDIIDAQFFNLDVNAVYQKLARKKYDLIGVSLYQETAASFKEFHELLRQNNFNSHICLGGQFPTFTAENLLKKFPLVNSIVIGEGELTLSELVENIPNVAWKNVKGICYLQEGEVVYTAPRELIKDLNSVPFPHREAYYGSLEQPASISAIISASRGCYASCAFCSIQSFYGNLPGKRIRIRHPVNVVDEMEHIYNTYDIKKFFFADDNFLVANLLQKDWLDVFINEVTARKLHISFDIDCRVNDIDIDLFKRLKKSGLNGVFLGIESFNQRQLNTLNKKTTVKDNIAAIFALRKLRLNVWMGFIMFDMFTTLAEVKQNLVVLDEINYFRYVNYDRPISSDWVSSILQLYNGTPILEMMKIKHNNLLVAAEFGYDFVFQSFATTKFYHWLLQWKPTVKKMIQMDTLQAIRLANSKGLSNHAADLHLLSRKYMQLDRNVFASILHAVEVTDEEKIPLIIQKGKEEFTGLAEQITRISNDCFNKS